MAKRTMAKKTRRSHRKGTRKATRRMRGGFIQLNPANVNDNSMNGPNNQNLQQGQGYLSAHAGQYGGQAPVGDTGMLESSIRGAARMGPLDASFNEIIGMKDQGGGRRRMRKSGKNRKGRSGRKGRKSRARRMRGGFAPVNADTTLLPTNMEKAAVLGMNPEWKLAENPASFDPTQ